MTLMNLKKKAKKGKGFTLVELLVVVAILAILAAALLPKFLGYTDKAREAQIMADLSTMKSVVEIYAADEGAGKYPAVDDTENGIGKVLTDAGINWAKADGVKDPYGHPYAYATVEEDGYNNQYYIIASPGKDGVFGGASDDDIYVTDNSGQPTKGNLLGIAGENTPWDGFFDEDFDEDEGDSVFPVGKASYSTGSASGTGE
jgi:general secretion pathway protein G